MAWRCCLLLALLAGCATVQVPSSGNPEHEARLACEQWYRALDRETDRAKVRDAAAAPVPGFRFLRADRYTASLASSALRDQKALEQWVGRMRALDEEGRRIEMANLPEAALRNLGATDRETAQARTTGCGQRLTVDALGSPSLGEQLMQTVRVHDNYVGWHRAVGLYPLTRLPFSLGVTRWQEEVRETFRRARAGEPLGHEAVRYLPPEGTPYSRGELAALLAQAPRPPLGVPEFSPKERERLFDTFAPVLEVETTGSHDRIGALVWHGQELGIDASRPVVYRKLAYARYGETTLLQLVYLAWFSERPKNHAFDLLGGRLDGIVWRVTLAPDGEPVLFDSMHPCGCFHLFFPTPRAQALPAPGRLLEWAFVPAAVPPLPDGARYVLQAQTRTHYLRDVKVDPSAAGLTYAFADYDVLRSLPRPDGTTRSAFAPNGLVPGTQRSERFLFWPMGVPSAGAMRQWGTHATAFLGRRHFDDADLIERRFLILPPVPQGRPPAGALGTVRDVHDSW